MTFTSYNGAEFYTYYPQRWVISTQKESTVSKPKVYEIQERLRKDSLSSEFLVWTSPRRADSYTISYWDEAAPLAVLETREDALAWIKRKYQLDAAPNEVVPPATFFKE